MGRIRVRFSFETVDSLESKNEKKRMKAIREEKKAQQKLSTKGAYVLNLLKTKNVMSAPGIKEHKSTLSMSALKNTTDLARENTALLKKLKAFEAGNDTRNKVCLCVYIHKNTYTCSLLNVQISNCN